MTAAFYIAAALATATTILVVTRANAVHALLYLVVSLLAVAVVFFTLGAPFVAALEVIVYAGAIMVLFIFVVMMLNPGTAGERQEREWIRPAVWIGPGLLSAALLAVLAAAVMGPEAHPLEGTPVPPHAVSIALYGPYVLAVELASVILLAGLIGAYHLGRRDRGAQGDGGGDR
jgi:NADH-quinone oxidoreductase subunit J